MVGPQRYSRTRSVIITLGVIATIAIAGTSIALGAARRHVVNPDTTVSYTATTTGPVVQGIQNGTGQGVEGLVGTAAGGIGILGFATSLTNAEVALEGLAWGPSSVGLYGQGLKNSDTTHPTVGLLGTSTSGVGVEGQSLVTTGAGVYGIASDGLSSGSLGVGGASGALGISGRGNFLSPGVEGESSSGSGDAAAGFGLNALVGGAHVPTYGVLGYGLGIGMRGVVTGSGAASTNIGVEGIDGGGASSFPDLNAGVFGSSDFGTGVLAEGGGAAPSMYFGSEPIGIYATAGVGSTGSPTAVSEFAEGIDASTFSFAAFNSASGNEVDLIAPDTDLLQGFGALSSFFTFDSNGNENLSGLITTSGPCSGGCSPVSGHHGRVISYAAQSSEPTIEDFGEGQVTGGVGHVAIDAAFARTIDPTKHYMVFLTPEGDNRGLYVTQRTASGFTVREAQGGASTLGFMYRIVAKPFGRTEARLPVIDITAMQMQRAARGHIHRASQPMDPYSALVNAVGPARAAQILALYKSDSEQRARMLKALPRSDANGTLHLGATTVAPTSVHN
jgi:hypothetical protein